MIDKIKNIYPQNVHVMICLIYILYIFFISCYNLAFFCEILYLMKGTKTRYNKEDYHNLIMEEYKCKKLLFDIHLSSLHPLFF